MEFVGDNRSDLSSVHDWSAADEVESDDGESFDSTLVDSTLSPETPEEEYSHHYRSTPISIV